MVKKYYIGRACSTILVLNIKSTRQQRCNSIWPFCNVHKLHSVYPYHHKHKQGKRSLKTNLFKYFFIWETKIYPMSTRDITYLPWKKLQNQLLGRVLCSYQQWVIDLLQFATFGWKNSALASARLLHLFYNLEKIAI